MSARSKMTMRALVERDTATGVDDFGHPVKPAFTVHGTFPCWAWSRQRRDVIDGSKSALVEDFRMLIPITADVLPGDEISSITNRRGVELFAGRVKIETVQQKHDHQEAGLEAVK